jgi:hypothetical protein
LAIMYLLHSTLPGALVSYWLTSCADLFHAFLLTYKHAEYSMPTRRRLSLW